MNKKEVALVRELLNHVAVITPELKQMMRDADLSISDSTLPPVPYFDDVREKYVKPKPMGYVEYMDMAGRDVLTLLHTCELFYEYAPVLLDPLTSDEDRYKIGLLFRKWLSELAR
jgi:hypothetical protein